MPEVMRPFRVRVATVVRRDGVLHTAVLKDYALSYILAGIAAVPELARSLAFKGGTALRKCFFSTYRYSEDLDFTAIPPTWTASNLETALREACAQTEELTRPYGAFTFTPELVQHRRDHPQQQQNFKIAVHFPTGAVDSIKVEITQEEPIVLSLRSLPLLHNFEDEQLSAELVCYDIAEIVIEKLRAFLQVRAMLERRAWTNRARDLYDLWYLHRQGDFPIDWALIRQHLPDKAAARGVTFAGPDDFRDPRVLAAYAEQWDGLLGVVIPQRPSFEEARAELDAVLREVFRDPD
jgi:predicted nucleotidyltransferase component of viral defense system